MKITREEFKELVALYEQVNKLASAAIAYVNEDLVYELSHPVYYWIEEKLGIDEESIGNDMFHMLTEEYEAGAYVNGEYTKDLDAVYDEYLNK